MKGTRERSGWPALAAIWAVVVVLLLGFNLGMSCMRRPAATVAVTPEDFRAWPRDVTSAGTPADGPAPDEAGGHVAPGLVVDVPTTESGLIVTSRPGPRRFVMPVPIRLSSGLLLRQATWTPEAGPPLACHTVCFDSVADVSWCCEGMPP